MFKKFHTSTLVESKVKWLLVCFLLIVGFHNSYGQADLTIETASISPNSVLPGNSINTVNVIRNLSSVNASSSNVGIYLSTNNTLDNTDIFIGSSVGNALSAHNFDHRYHYITIPTSTEPGSYYVLFVADFLNNLTETNENNNVGSAALSIEASYVDLTLYSLRTSTSVSAGNDFNANISINNQGNAFAPSSDVGYYLSTNNTYDPTDTYIGSVSTYSIYAGSSNYSRDATLSIPNSFIPGNYYLIAVADYLNVITEANEDNNTTSTSIRILPPGATFNVPASGSVSYTTCAGILYDNGGSSDYSNSVNGTVTLNPAIAGNKIKLIFSSFSVEGCCDGLTIYDGTSTAAPLIGNYNSNPGTIYATNSTGALTLVFHTDGSVVYSGFEAEIACVTTLPLPDLAIQSPYVYNTSILPGRSLTVSGYLNNLSPVAAASSITGYYLSHNTTFEPTDVYLGILPSYAAQGNSSNYQSQSVTIPDDVAAGDYYILFVADYSNIINEEIETNNTNAVPIVVLAPTYDLAVQAVATSSSNIAPGSEISVTANITNAGNSSTPSSNVSFYLSTDNSLTTNDILLNTVAVGSLTSSGTDYRTATINIPIETVLGSYYIVAVVDQENVMIETNETNNFNTTAIELVEPTMDLIALGISGPESMMPGASPKCSVSVKNLGNIASSTCDLKIYLSSDNILEADDILINAGSSYGPIQPGINYDLMSGYTIPANTAVGNYYILAKVDYNNRVAESNETNNVTIKAITIYIPALPDLVIQSPNLPSNKINAGRGLSFSSIIANVGNASTTKSTRLSIYLSNNNTLEESDLLIGQGITITGYLSNNDALAESDLLIGQGLTSIEQLAANASCSIKAEILYIPLNIAAGDYFVLMKIDSNNEVAESNETNNVINIPITVTNLPDLFLMGGYLAEKTARPGETISVGGHILNIGLFPAASSNLDYYLSTNNTFDTNDILLGTSTSGPFTGGQTIQVRGTVSIPNTTNPGNYFIIYVADNSNSIIEIEETNNQSYLPLVVTGTTTQPDLAVHNVSSSSNNIETGKPTLINSTILNQGNINANPHNLGIYLSANNTLESTDVLLATQAVQTLSPSAESNLQSDVIIPVGTAPGTYFILVKADNNNEVTESNETNNVSSLVVMVHSSVPDLKIQSLAINVGTIIPGGTITATARVTNVGTSDLSASKINYYLSVDNSFENTDVLLGESILKLLTPNTTAELTVNLAIPASTATGNYYVLMVINDISVINEKDELNKEASTALRVSTPTGIKDLAAEYSVSVSPNPTPDKVNIAVANLNKGESTAEIALYNATGSKILSANARVVNNKLATTLDLSHFSNGMYILHMKIGTTLITKKIVVEKE